MDFRCKFVLMGDLAEITLFETVKERIENELVWDISGLDRMEFETRDYNTEPTGLVRVPIVFKFHTNTHEEMSTIFDVYTWTSGMIRRYGAFFGLDEITVDGQHINLIEAYRVPQLQVL